MQHIENTDHVMVSVPGAPSYAHTLIEVVIDRNTVYHKIPCRKLAEESPWFEISADSSLKDLRLLPVVGLDTYHPNNDPTTGMLFSTL